MRKMRLHIRAEDSFMSPTVSHPCASINFFFLLFFFILRKKSLHCVWLHDLKFHGNKTLLHMIFKLTHLHSQ